MLFYRTLLLFCLYTTLLPAQTDDLQEKAQTYLNEAIQNGHCVGIAAGTMTNGALTWKGQAGHTTLAKTAPFTEQTSERIASITKPMTAIAIMQLVNAGKLELEAPVGNYLPVFSTGPKSKITILHVLQHASGLRAYADNKERNNSIEYATLADALTIFVEDDLEFAPGVDFGYTSYGYVVLGRLIEEASGLTYEDYLRKHIWEPAGMTETFVERNRTEPLYHQKKPGKIKKGPLTSVSDRVPGGGVQSSAMDLLRFGDAVMTGKLIPAETLEQMIVDSGLKKEGNGYGMGWYLYGDKNKYGNLFGHNGAQLGCSSFMMLMPKSGTTVVILANTSGALDEVGRILNGLLAIGYKLAE